MTVLKISGEALLGALEDRLTHLVECEQILFDLYDHPDKPLTTIPKKVKLGDWETKNLGDVVYWVERVREEKRVALQKGEPVHPVKSFIEALPRLNQAASLVSSASHVLRYHLTDKTRIEDNKIVYRSLRDRLDRLSHFDDSE